MMEKNLKQFLPKEYQKKRYYTPVDIEVHNNANDCWISLFNEVYDLTHLIQSNINCNI